MKKFMAFAAVLILAPIISARAQWVLGPGDLVSYTANYTFTGGVNCSSSQYFVGACTNTASGVRLFSGTAWQDITFEGSASAVTASNVSSTVRVGRVTAVAGGVGPFAWHASISSPVIPLFGFNVLATITQPVALTSQIFAYHFVPDNATLLSYNCCDGDYTYGVFPFTPQPAPLHYSNVVFSLVTYPSFSANAPNTQDIYAVVGLIPEPSTYALTFAGLLAIGLIARRRRQTQTG